MGAGRHPSILFHSSALRFGRVARKCLSSPLRLAGHSARLEKSHRCSFQQTDRGDCSTAFYVAELGCLFHSGISSTAPQHLFCMRLFMRQRSNWGMLAVEFVFLSHSWDEHRIIRTDRSSKTPIAHKDGTCGTASVRRTFCICNGRSCTQLGPDR